MSSPQRQKHGPLLRGVPSGHGPGGAMGHCDDGHPSARRCSWSFTENAPSLADERCSSVVA